MTEVKTMTYDEAKQFVLTTHQAVWSFDGEYAWMILANEDYGHQWDADDPTAIDTDPLLHVVNDDERIYPDEEAWTTIQTLTFRPLPPDVPILVNGYLSGIIALAWNGMDWQTAIDSYDGPDY